MTTKTRSRTVAGGLRRARGRRRLSFSTQTLVFQLGVVALVVLVCTGMFAYLSYGETGSQVEARALAVANSVAARDDVRKLVTAVSAATAVPGNAELRGGPIQRAAEEVRRRTAALFVVITDDDGIRLSHPTPSLLGKMVSTSPSADLKGKVVTAIENGTLGPSARAKVPIWSPDHRRVVGEVSVGFSMTSVMQNLAALILPLIGVGIGVLILAAAASAALVRRLRTLTLGLEPEEISALVQDQEVVLYGVGEGVIGTTPDGVITVCNAKARRLLGLPDVIGDQIRFLSIPAPIIDLLDRPQLGDDASVQVVVGQSVLVVTARKVTRGASDLGWVIMVRDRTDVEALSRQLFAVEALSTALRAQRHEFANRLHTISGLLEIGETAEAAHYLRQTLETGPLKHPVEHGDRLQDSYLQAFVGAKGSQAAERGVLLRIGAETLIAGAVVDPQDVTTVLGNLIDNAVVAAVHGRDESRWVEIELLSEGDTLHLVVADSGDGIGGDRELPFVEGYTTATGMGDESHGHGLGLALSRQIARRRGGDVWLASAGAVGGPGAVFCARLPGVLSAEESVRPASPRAVV
ncbi:ATP-binding protein [Lacisediminihabitans sp.]|uniref:sensor histidine kinase n=1 Tax=Lacisediminihabitans sp. TaxID=2787631 RepID=UPI00374D3647